MPVIYHHNNSIVHVKIVQLMKLVGSVDNQQWLYHCTSLNPTHNSYTVLCIQNDEERNLAWAGAHLTIIILVMADDFIQQIKAPSS